MLKGIWDVFMSPCLWMLWLLIALGVVNAGCSLPANPHTSIGVNPWTHTVEFYNSKDMAIHVEGVKYDANTKGFELAKLDIVDNASDVRRANVEQINAYTEQVKATTSMMTQMTASIASMLPYVRPATSTSINTPYGGGTVTTTPVLPPAALPAPASQPGPPLDPPR